MIESKLIIDIDLEVCLSWLQIDLVSSICFRIVLIIEQLLSSCYNRAMAQESNVVSVAEQKK
jgi:hypothetical protein